MGLYQQSLELKEKIGNMQGKAATLHEMAVVLAGRGEVERAMGLYQQSLELKEKSGDVRGKAGTLHQMAGVLAGRGEVERAMGLYQQSLELKEKSGDVRGKAATLHAMAGLLAGRGEVERAMGLYQQSLDLEEKTGDVRGKAATLHQMAGVLADRGEVERAMGLYQQSLEIKEKTGDVQGKAATLANMAWIASHQHNPVRERELNLEAARALASIGAAPDLITVLANLGTSDDADAAGFLAQALWLALRVEVPLRALVDPAVGLLMKVGPAAEAGPLLAATALWAVNTRGKGHPEAQEMGTVAMRMIRVCAAERKIPKDKFLEWFRAERLNDRNHFLPALDRALLAIVGEGNWMFDRAAFARVCPASQPAPGGAGPDTQSGD